MKCVAVVVVVLSLAASAVVAEPPKAPPPKAAPKPLPPEAELFAQLIRERLGKSVPDPLTRSSQNWGHQKATTVVHRRREGLRFWTEPVQEFQNDGVWRRVEVRIPDPAKLSLAVTELTYPEAGKVVATVAVTCGRVDVKFEQQVWRNGLRLYGGETRAHCEAALVLNLAVTTKTEYKKGSFLPIPEVTVRVRATEAKLFHNKLVVDHTAGLDGEAAKSVGDVLIRVVQAFQPDLEHDLTEKANAAVVKAAGDREFKLALDKVLAGKK